MINKDINNKLTDYKDSLRNGLSKLLMDPKVFLLGEDIIEPYGGAYSITKGMSDKFPNKLINTPMSEQAFTGLGVGMALGGYKPIVEIMFGDFSTLILDQVLNHASKFVEGFNSKMHLVIRVPMGGYRGYGATHSQSLEKLFFGLPNITVVAPSVLQSPGELLVNSLELGIPVIFVENKLDYTRKMFSSESYSSNFVIKHYGNSKFPIIEVNIKKEENPEITIISYGGMIKPTLDLIYKLYIEEELPIRLLDISLLSPIDFDLLSGLLQKSKKILTIEEGHIPSGFGDIIISNLCQRGHKAEFKSIGATLNIIGSSKEAENMVLPNFEKIAMFLKEW